MRKQRVANVEEEIEDYDSTKGQHFRATDFSICTTDYSNDFPSLVFIPLYSIQLNNLVSYLESIKTNHVVESNNNCDIKRGIRTGLPRVVYKNEAERALARAANKQIWDEKNRGYAMKYYHESKEAIKIKKQMWRDKKRAEAKALAASLQS